VKGGRGRGAVGSAKKKSTGSKVKTEKQAGHLGGCSQSLNAAKGVSAESNAKGES